MAEDFGYAWRTVRLHCPSAPTFLAREFVQTAYKQLLAARHWTFMRAELSVTTLAGDTHLLMPSDFGSFKVVVDETRKIRLPFHYTIEQLARTGLGATGAPAALIATSPLSGQVRYRLYPHGSPATILAVYHRQAPRLIDGDVFTGVLADGAEVLVAGALAQAALWPGTGEKPNPYFNATLAASKSNEFKVGIQMLALRDDEQARDDFWDFWPEDCHGLMNGGGGEGRESDACSC